LPAPFYRVGGLSHVRIHTLTFANHRCSTPDHCEIEVHLTAPAQREGAAAWVPDGVPVSCARPIVTKRHQRRHARAVEGGRNPPPSQDGGRTGTRATGSPEGGRPIRRLARTARAGDSAVDPVT
jgi:hypothetical protein